MATRAAAASTHAPAAEAATRAFLVEPGEAPATAIDAVLAGVLALALRHAAVLLSSGTILLGGTGEGLLAIDGRARQPGRSAPRPRGFTDATAVPDAAKIAAPLLPAALTLAHAGRGVRTRTALLSVALAASRDTHVDEARIESLRAFGREGGAILRGGAIRDALLAAGARSVGGALTREDLDALRAELTQAKSETIGVRTWSRAPFPLDAAPPGELAIVAACDTHGALAIASILIPTFTLALPDVGLAAPLLAQPVLRGVTREAAGAPIPLAAAIGLARSGDAVDLAIGVGGGADVERAFNDVARAASESTSILEEAITHGERVAGVMIDARQRGRALTR